MPLTRSSLERQLEQATASLNAWTKSLDERKISAEDRVTDPKWRSLNSKCKQLKARLRSVGAVETREDEAARRKAEQAEAAENEPAAQEEAPEPKKAKKQKAAAK